MSYVDRGVQASCVDVDLVRSVPSRAAVKSRTGKRTGL